MVPVARRINGADGRFAGITYANISVSYFNDKFATLSLGQRGLVALRYEDHFSLARYPDMPDGDTRIGPFPISRSLGYNSKTSPRFSLMHGYLPEA